MSSIVLYSINRYNDLKLRLCLIKPSTKTCEGLKVMQSNDRGRNIVPHDVPVAVLRK
jgi:hypothetical protein